MGLQQSKLKLINQNSNQYIQSLKFNQNNFFTQNIIHNLQTCRSYQLFSFEQKYFVRFIGLIKSRQRLRHKNFITVKKYWRKLNKNKNKQIKCNVNKIAQLYLQYEYRQMNISQLIRQNNGKYFKQSQIRRIFLDILSCLIYLKANGTCHGDIKPQNIIYDDIGNVKLLDLFFINGGKTSYQIVLENPSSKSFLSPEQLQQLTNKQFDSIQNVYKNQVFSLGLTMYQCMSLERGMECYDLDKLVLKKNYFIDKNIFLKRIGYSKQLIDLVLGLILSPADQRLEFQEIFNILAQY